LRTGWRYPPRKGWRMRLSWERRRTRGFRPLYSPKGVVVFILGVSVGLQFSTCGVGDVYDNGHGKRFLSAVIIPFAFFCEGIGESMRRLYG
jgi:hypothetical protein